MRIEMWADVANPWTNVAAERLRGALSAAGVGAEVVWRPLLTDPADPDAARDALRLLLLAEEYGGLDVQARVAAGLLASRDVRDLAELAAVAERAGFPQGGRLLAGEAGVSGVAGDAGRARLRELLLVGKARGITVSPTLAIGDRLLEFVGSPAAIGEFLSEPDPDFRTLPEEVQRLRWAEELVALSDPLGALVLLEPLRAEHGQDPNIRRVAASAYFASAQLGRARAVLEAMLADNPADAYARLMLGRTLKRQGRAEEAGVHLRMAAAMTPDYA